MITGVRDVYYYVENMERAVAFYTGVLGMKVLFTDPWWTSLEIGGSMVGLHGTGGQPVPEVPRDAHGARAGGTLTLRSDDIDADLKALESANVKILGTLDEEWGRLVAFEDSEGNVLKLMQPAD